MPITDQNIGWMRKRERYTLGQMQGIDGSQASGIPQGAVSAGVTEVEVGVSKGLIAYDMANGDLVTGIIPVPHDLDPTWSIGFRTIYTLNHDGTGTATTAWILLYDMITQGSAWIIGATALDTVMGVHTYVDSTGAISSTDALMQTGNRGILLPETHALSRAKIEDGAFISVSLEQNAVVNATNGAQFLFLEMDYVPFKCVGGGNIVDAPLQADQQA